jgi:hypothetical protein
VLQKYIENTFKKSVRFNAAALSRFVDRGNFDQFRTFHTLLLIARARERERERWVWTYGVMDRG